MATFPLVHGSWHGAWCWERVLPLLAARGPAATAIDLPAHGGDRTPAFRASLGAYARRVALAAERLREKPVVVGHGTGGLAITQAAFDAPETDHSRFPSAPAALADRLDALAVLAH